MLSRILSAALLSLSLPLTGCVADELDERSYAASSYSSYAGQHSAYADPRERYSAPPSRYPIIIYQQYPQPQHQHQRYRLQRQPVYYTRPAPVGYWPAPAWQGRQDDSRRHHQRAHSRDRYHERDRIEYGREQRQQYQSRGEAQRGWTLRLN